MSRPLAIFDLDGTLVDSRRDLADAGNAARAAVGLPALGWAEISQMVGDGASKLIERLTPDRDATARSNAMAAFRSDYATRLTTHTRPYPGIPELVAALRGHGWAVSVATNKPSEFAKPILDRLNLRVDGLRGGETARKPDPAPLLSLMRDAGANAASTWMIGDHHADILAGRNAGCRVLWCAWGFGRRDGHEPDAIAHAPHEAQRILLA